MNTAWGVEEIHSGVILTQSYEPPVREQRGKEGDHYIAYDVSSPDGIFGAGFDTNAYGDYCNNVRFYSSEITNILESKYKEIVINAVHYYENNGYKNGDFKTFQNEFEEKSGEDLYHYQRKIFQMFYDKWKSKWS